MQFESRCDDPDDWRIVMVRLTNKAKEFIDCFLAHDASCLRPLLEQMTARDLEDFGNALGQRIQPQLFRQEADCLDAEALGIVPGFRTLHPAALQQTLVQALKIHRRQLLQRDLTESGLDVAFDEALVGLVGRGPDLELGVVLHPGIQPLAHGVLLCPQRLDTTFLNCRSELLLDLCLGSAEDIL